MKKKLLVLFLAAEALTLTAQILESFPPPQASSPAPAAPQPSPQAPVSPAGTPALSAQPVSLESGAAERTIDKVFDVNSDSFETENGSIKWKGKTFSIGDSRIVRARFERYLARPVDSAGFNSYQAILSEIISQLAPSNDNLDEELIRAAWDRLFDAAEYDYDGSASIMIANVVYQSWRMRSEYEIKRMEESEKLRAEKDSRNRMVMHAEFMEYANDKLKREMSLSRQRSGGNSGDPRSIGTAELAARTLEWEKAVADTAASKTSREATALKAILQFQSQIVSFLMGRNFQQAQIASMFYRHIYRGNAQDLQVGKEQLGDFIQISQFTPSVDTLEMVAMQARKDASDGMKAVEAIYNSGELYGDLQRLMETFIIGEYEPSLVAFDYEKKKVLHGLYRDVSAIKSLADAKDWGGIEKTLGDIRKVASDFPYREILSKVQTAQRASDMHLMSAKQAAALGKADDVKKALISAMEIWPLNPAIKEFNEDLVDITAGMEKFSRKFDELLSQGNFRAISLEAPEYGLAFRNDTARASKLKEVVLKISQIDAMLAQAAEFEKQKNPYFAWDVLENARAIDPNDPDLARAFAHLAPEVSDYVKILGKAKSAEAEGRYPEALNLYLSAQDIFPASQACRTGIERVAPRYAE